MQLSASTTTAYQRFLSTGPIAMLPLDAGWASLVWTLPVPEAARVVRNPPRLLRPAPLHCHSVTVARPALNFF
jgi:2-polyprenyl-6-methoxyphenol hydroxylase-like FAD-dependent oxidoreductase